jgi:hypothetical protein
MEVEELLPIAFTRFDKVLRGWEAFHKGASCWHGPVVKSLQSRRAILVKGLLELVDERGAFFDQGQLVATEEPQLADKGVLRP